MKRGFPQIRSLDFKNAGDGAGDTARMVGWHPLKFEERFGRVATVEEGALFGRARYPEVT